jgi:hypothetical protein
VGREVLYKPPGVEGGETLGPPTLGTPGPKPPPGGTPGGMTSGGGGGGPPNK